VVKEQPVEARQAAAVHPVDGAGAARRAADRRLGQPYGKIFLDIQPAQNASV